MTKREQQLFSSKTLLQLNYQRIMSLERGPSILMVNIILLENGLANVKLYCNLLTFSQSHRHVKYFFNLRDSFRINNGDSYY